MRFTQILNHNYMFQFQQDKKTMLISQFVILEGQIHDMSQESGQPFPVCFPHRSRMSDSSSF